MKYEDLSKEELVELAKAQDREIKQLTSHRNIGSYLDEETRKKLLFLSPNVNGETGEIQARYDVGTDTCWTIFGDIRKLAREITKKASLTKNKYGKMRYVLKSKVLGDMNEEEFKTVRELCISIINEMYKAKKSLYGDNPSFEVPKNDE